MSGLYTLRQVAGALSVTLRRVRSWADSGSLTTLQPQRNAERLVAATELLRWERTLGYRVDWEQLDAADAAHAADSAISVTRSNEGKQ